MEAQPASDTSQTEPAGTKGQTYQAKAPQTQRFRAEAFEASNKTTLRWLGMAGFLITNRGTTLMVDPLLGWFDMPIHD